MCAPSTSASDRMQILAVAQVREIGLGVHAVGPVRIDNRSPPRCHALRCSRTAGRAPFPRCSAPLPRKGRMAWNSLSRPIFADPPAESPSTRNNFVALDIRRFAIGKLGPATPATPELLRFSTFCPARVRAWRLPDHEFRQLLAVFHMLVEPQLECGPRETTTPVSPRRGY